jgi:hypothetical protein
MKKYLICILQHRNSSYAITAFLHILQALRANPALRDECKIVFAATSRGDTELHKVTQFYGNEVDVEIFECNPSYPEKIKAVLENYPPENFKFFIKHDEDLFLSPHSWEKLLTLSEEMLEDTHNLLTTVNLSTGIPTWYAFDQSFFPKKILDTIYDNLYNDAIPNECWGNNYSAINTAIRAMSPNWDENVYWQNINALPYDYKGIHPVRTNIWYTKTINEYISNNYSTLMRSTPKSTFTYISDRYFCNSFFIMNYKTYKTIFEDRTLYSDAFDEVPINRYLQRHNLSFLTLDDSCGVHIMYNSVYGQKIKFDNTTYNGAMLEEEFSRLYFSHSKNALAPTDNQVKKFSFVATPLHRKLQATIKQTKFYSKLYKSASQNSHIKKLYKSLFQK